MKRIWLCQECGKELPRIAEQDLFTIIAALRTMKPCAGCGNSNWMATVSGAKLTHHEGAGA